MGAVTKWSRRSEAGPVRAQSQGFGRHCLERLIGVGWESLCNLWKAGNVIDLKDRKFARGCHLIAGLPVENR